MRFSCDDCGRTYEASDELAGRAFRMRCKQCGAEIEVRPPAPAPTPLPASSPTPAPRNGRPAATRARAAFDPFEGELPGAELPEGDVVSEEALEILDRTPAPRPLPRTPPPAAAAAPRAAPSRPTTSGTPPVRPRRMLPAEDEAKLGPPGAEDRRAIPRWLIYAAVAALAAAGGLALLR